MPWTTTRIVAHSALVAIAYFGAQELFFRGFLVSTLTSVGAGGAMAVLPPSMIWAAVHVHYDLYGMTTVFVMGLLLAGARLASGSLWPPLLMHALANAVVFAEAALTAWRFLPR